MSEREKEDRRAAFLWNQYLGRDVSDFFKSDIKPACECLPDTAQHRVENGMRIPFPVTDHRPHGRRI